MACDVTVTVSHYTPRRWGGGRVLKAKKKKGNYTGGEVSNQNPSMEKVWILTGTNIYNII